MTVQEMIIEVFRDVGEPTDLWIYDSNDAFDITLAGSVKILSFLNRAYKRITNWKLENGTIIRFQSLNRRAFFVVNEVDTTVASGSGTALVLGNETYQIDDKYNEWILEHTSSSERRLIIDWDGTSRTATLHKAFTTDPTAADAVVLYKKFMLFDDSGSNVHTGEVIALDAVTDVITVQGIYDLTNEKYLERGTREWVESLWEANYYKGQSDPNLWLPRRNGIEFDSPPNDGTSYLLKYYGAPASLSAATDVPEIPEPWHEVMVFWAAWRVLKRERSTDDAYALRKDIDDMAWKIVQQAEHSFDEEHGAAYLLGG